MAIEHGKTALLRLLVEPDDRPKRADLLKDIALMTFFLDPEVGNRTGGNGKDWVLRAYKSLDGLAPLDRPADAPRVRGFECRWEKCLDYPVFDDPEVIVPEGFDPSVAELDNVRRTKIGGYASNIQSEPWWGYRRHPAEPRYCSQVSSEEKVGLIWGDSAAVYLARGTAPGFEAAWFLDWKCY